ncbi:MAG: type II toxin-antitoxin system PemK/MazF family toxin [Candidatus Aminicenantes bacterium]|nr:type II toxin-antitoxin system PemK/MazF family toxin [Candidatus Aminicenantes bacterium]
MERGTVVLTKFPFTDLSSAKRRPAVIISRVSNEKEDVIVAFISSVIPYNLSETDFVLDTGHKDFAATGLKKKSVFKMDKLATLNKSIFSGIMGNISVDILKQLESRLMFALDLKKTDLF